MMPGWLSHLPSPLASQLVCFYERLFPISVSVSQRRALQIQQLSDVWGMCGKVAQHVSSHLPVASLARSLSSLVMLSRMRRRITSARITSDALAATRLTLNAIQASTDIFPPLKSSASVVLVIMELSQRAKLNKKGCEHTAKRSAQLVQDIWRQTKDFGVVLPEEVERSVVDIENLFKEIESFFGGLETENTWERFVSPRSAQEPSCGVRKIIGRGHDAVQFQS
ncbi:hypothetical protein B0H14DRAFT_3892518 [Mycena olivaceomarginata]|nr:hypothetical protein B0H14DRAFT_3892518 [Mycena olivaceomarginata]